MYLFENKEICEAFKEARTDVEVKFNRNEANLFKLYTQDNHKCIPFAKRQDGKFENLSRHTQIKKAKSKL